MLLHVVVCAWYCVYIFFVLSRPRSTQVARIIGPSRVFFCVPTPSEPMSVLLTHFRLVTSQPPLYVLRLLTKQRSPIGPLLRPTRRWTVRSLDWFSTEAWSLFLRTPPCRAFMFWMLFLLRPIACVLSTQFSASHETFSFRL